jgi:hypothetical protein
VALPTRAEYSDHRNAGMRGAAAVAVLLLGGLSMACAGSEAAPDFEGTVQARVEGTARAAVTPTHAPTETALPRPTAEPTATLVPMVPMIDLVVPVWELGSGYGERSSNVFDSEADRRFGGRSIQLIASAPTSPTVVQHVACERDEAKARAEFEQDTTLTNGWTAVETRLAQEHPNLYGRQPRWFPISPPIPGGRAFRNAEIQDNGTYSHIWLATLRNKCVVAVTVAGYEGTRSQPTIELARNVTTRIHARID